MVSWTVQFHCVSKCAVAIKYSVVFGACPCVPTGTRPTDRPAIVRIINQTFFISRSTSDAITHRAEAAKRANLQRMPRAYPWRQQARGTYRRHRLAWDLAFFAAGFVFDVFAASAGVDHLLM